MAADCHHSPGRSRSCLPRGRAGAAAGGATARHTRASGTKSTVNVTFIIAVLITTNSDVRNENKSE